MPVTEPNKFRVESVQIKIYRQFEDPTIYDIANSSVELNLFEDINMPYVTGVLTIVDTAAISSLNFTGSETIRIRLHNNEAYPIDKEFVIWQVTDYTHESDHAKLYNLHLMEKHGYLNNFQFVSRAYEGKHSDIIQRIFHEYFELDITNEESYKSSKFIVPNIRPLEACDWILKNTTSDYGEPFFLYSSLKDGVRLASLGSLYKETPLPVKFYRRPNAKHNFNEYASHIISFIPSSNERLIDIARKGAISANLYVIDPFENDVRIIEYDYEDRFKTRVAIGHELYRGILYDSSLPLDTNKTIQTSDKQFVSSISTTSSFDNGTTGFFEFKDPADYSHVLSRKSDELFLDKQSIDIMIPGWHMLAYESNTSIGRILNINIPKTAPSTTRNSSEAVLDQKLSGNFLVTNIRHKFQFIGESYVSSLTLKRSSSMNESMNGEVYEDPI